LREGAVIEELSEADWQELTLLLEEAPPGRIQVAVSRVSPSVISTTEAAPRLVTSFDRLMHLAAVSSGSAFDHALLRELRRLGVH
jgi:hypothetical protein